MKRKKEQVDFEDQFMANEGKGPFMVAFGEDEIRRNVSSTKERTDKYSNIESILNPFKTSRGSSSGSINIQDMVVLCQKAYRGIPIFRNVIDLMTEFSVGQIYWKGGSKKGREFQDALWDNLNIWSIQDKFYREYYRSGNVFELRFDGKATQEDLTKLTQVFGNKKSKGTLPVKYIVLNPADIHLGGTISFSDGVYQKILSDYELERLKKPTTPQEQAFLESLPADVQKSIKNKAGGGVLIPLDAEKLKIVFYKRQDYEPFAVPMGWGVLADLNWKEEMKRIDMAVSRTMKTAILLLTMGESPKDGGMGVDQNNIVAMQRLMANQSAVSVIVCDYTTKGQWLIPDISTFLGPTKYQIVNQDIQVGLNYVLFGDEKFANQQVKVQVFIERLKEGRNAFIREFLLPEVKRISEDWGFKNYPTPYYEDVNLKDDLQFGRLYVQMVQYGILTPEEGIQAILDNKLPTKDESLESQKELKKLKDDGLYQPIAGGPASQMDMVKETGKQANKTLLLQQEHDEKTQKRQLKHDAENPVTPAPSIHIQAPTKSVPNSNGRPAGSKRPQSTKNVKPMKGSSSEEKGEVKNEGIFKGYSLTKIKENFILASKLNEDVEKSLTEDKKQLAPQITEIIIANEEPKDWLNKISEYIENPMDKNPQRIKEVQDIAFEHQLDDYLAAILKASIIEE